MDAWRVNISPIEITRVQVQSWGESKYLGKTVTYEDQRNEGNRQRLTTSSADGGDKSPSWFEQFEEAVSFAYSALKKQERTAWSRYRNIVNQREAFEKLYNLKKEAVA